MTAFRVGTARVCTVCGQPAVAAGSVNGVSPGLCVTHLPELMRGHLKPHIPPAIGRYPGVCVESLWLDERDCRVWRVADMCERPDGNASIVMARVDHHPDDVESDDLVAVSQRWLYEHADYTRIDGHTAEQFLGPRTWFRRAGFWLRALFRRRK